MADNLPDAATLASVLSELDLSATGAVVDCIVNQQHRTCKCRNELPKGQVKCPCKEAIELENAIISRLAHRCFPIVAGLLDRLSRRIGELGGRVRDHDIMSVSFIVAHRLFMGNCDCCEDGDQERMRRENPCGEEHKLRSWVPDTDFNAFLKHALLNEVSKTGKFDRMGPEETRADCFNLLQRRNPKDLARGMALRQVNIDIRGRTVVFGIFQIPKCKVCDDAVSVDNQCACTRSSVAIWPSVAKLTYIVDDIATRCHQTTGESFPMYRCRQGAGGEHIHGGDEKDGGLLYFPIWNEGVETCPVCEQPVAGKASNPQMQISDVRPVESGEALDKVAGGKQTPTYPFDRLIDCLLVTIGPHALELTEFARRLIEIQQNDGCVNHGIFAEMFAELSKGAQQQIRRLFQ